MALAVCLSILPLLGGWRPALVEGFNQGRLFIWQSFRRAKARFAPAGPRIGAGKSPMPLSAPTRKTICSFTARMAHGLGGARKNGARGKSKRPAPARAGLFLILSQIERLARKSGIR